MGKWFRRLMHCQLFMLPMGRKPDQEIENLLQGWADYAEIHGLNTKVSEDEDEDSQDGVMPAAQGRLRSPDLYRPNSEARPLDYYRPNYEGTTPKPPHEGSDEWTLGARRNPASATTLRQTTPSKSNIDTRESPVEQPVAGPSRSSGPPPIIHKGFMYAEHTSNLTERELERHDRVRRPVPNRTTFDAIMTAPVRCGGRIDDAVDHIMLVSAQRASRPQSSSFTSVPGSFCPPSAGQATTSRPPPSMSSAMLPPGPRATQALGSVFPAAPGGPGLPRPNLPARPTPSALPPTAPGTKPQYSTSLGAPPSIAPKRPAVLDDEALIERELKRTKPDSRMARAKLAVQSAMEPAPEYPKQTYNRREERALRERDGNVGLPPARPPAASSDDECVITEVRKLKSSSEDEESESGSGSEDDDGE